MNCLKITLKSSSNHSNVCAIAFPPVYSQNSSFFPPNRSWIKSEFCQHFRFRSNFRHKLWAKRDQFFFPSNQSRTNLKFLRHFRFHYWSFHYWKHWTKTAQIWFEQNCSNWVMLKWPSHLGKHRKIVLKMNFKTVIKFKFVHKILTMKVNFRYQNHL